MEGRPVPKGTFVYVFFSAMENVDRIKSEFKSEIQLDLIIKNVDQGTQKAYFNIEKVAYYVKIEYTPQTLQGLLK